jgi:hypothetical protein
VDYCAPLSLIRANAARARSTLKLRRRIAGRKLPEHARLQLDPFRGVRSALQVKPERVETELCRLASGTKRSEALPDLLE